MDFRISRWKINEDIDGELCYWVRALLAALRLGALPALACGLLIAALAGFCLWLAHGIAIAAGMDGMANLMAGLAPLARGARNNPADAGVRRQTGLRSWLLIRRRIF